LATLDVAVTVRAIDRVAKKLTGEVAAGARIDFFYEPTLEIWRPSTGVRIQLDKFLAIDPTAFPLHVDQKVTFSWTYLEHKRVVVRVALD